jgi:hypothetical protein
MGKTRNSCPVNCRTITVGWRAYLGGGSCTSQIGVKFPDPNVTKPVSAYEIIQDLKSLRRTNNAHSEE